MTEKNSNLAIVDKKSIEALLKELQYLNDEVLEKVKNNANDINSSSEKLLEDKEELELKLMQVSNFFEDLEKRENNLSKSNEKLVEVFKLIQIYKNTIEKQSENTNTKSLNAFNRTSLAKKVQAYKDLKTHITGSIDILIDTNSILENKITKFTKICKDTENSTNEISKQFNNFKKSVWVVSGIALFTSGFLIGWVGSHYSLVNRFKDLTDKNYMDIIYPVVKSLF